MQDKRFISTEELSELLDIPAPSIATWRFRGEGPKYLKLGRHVRYDVSDVEQWLRERTREAK